MTTIQKLFHRIRLALAEIDHGFSLMYGLAKPGDARKATRQSQ